ncbi:antibiotic biosynthesis monooxygenase family protein [Pelagibaculum spongiae]|uniref:Antibiotic biosynthesis monooxygenase n=1 Tax=Pelagibaculum spongiae TaxID=2080658 RepID=A0A2V1GRG1_9GAMM|nr:antibiotic biosynthesis monooxygenase [Pelagibaculum spongiae]PVZ63889.1 antibiotic biosynthesis monooxygenase [Pelagibaculum spongiae]
MSLVNEPLIAQTSKPPYYAVIFSSLLQPDSAENGYSDMANTMVELAQQQSGYLGVESAREALGITVSYWKDLESIKVWKANVDHLQAQKLGREKWYASYKVRIARVDKEYGI